MSTAEATAGIRGGDSVASGARRGVKRPIRDDADRVPISFPRPTRVLVVGSEGTIGTQLVRKLRSTGHDVWRTDRVKMKAERYVPSDITRHETLAKVFAAAKPQVVFHLAGEVSREICEHWPTVATEANVLGTMNVALSCMEHNARVVYAGSSEEYGDAFSGGPVTEHTAPGRKQGVYALTKWMAEEVLEYWHRTQNLSVVVVRIFMCYGQEMPSAYRSAISQFIYRARKGEDLVVHRGGRRAWCHINDIVDGLLAASAYRWPEDVYELFLLGRDENVGMEDVANQIISLLGSKSRIRVINPPPGITPVKEARFDKAYHLLQWKSTTPFYAGLRQEIEWQKENVPLNIRGEP